MSNCRATSHANSIIISQIIRHHSWFPKIAAFLLLINDLVLRNKSETVKKLVGFGNMHYCNKLRGVNILGITTNRLVRDLISFTTFEQLPSNKTV